MAVLGGLYNYLTQSPAAGAVAVQRLLAQLPPSGNAKQYSVYLAAAPKQAPPSFVVMHLLDAPPGEHTLDGPSGLQAGEFQFDAYGTDEPTARALAQAVRDALKNFSGALNDGSTIEFYEVAFDGDDGYGEGGLGYLFRSIVRLRAFFTEPGQ